MARLERLKWCPHRAEERAERWVQYYAVGLAENPHFRSGKKWDIYTIRETDTAIDREHFQSGNYFTTREDAAAAIHWLCETERFLEWKRHKDSCPAKRQRKAPRIPSSRSTPKDMLLINHPGLFPIPKLRHPRPKSLNQRKNKKNKI